MNKITGKPILFNTEMVKAILDGRKTQTRRAMKPQIDLSDREWLLKPEAIPLEKEWRKMPEPHDGYHIEENMWGLFNKKDKAGDVPYTGLKCPYGKIGDELWVRETWGILKVAPHSICFRYDAQHPYGRSRETLEQGRWRPSIHLPRYLSRIQLRIIGMRVERLCNISDIDASAEGYGPAVMKDDALSGDPRKQFLMGDWAKGKIDDNPWVWVIEFKVI